MLIKAGVDDLICQELADDLLVKIYAEYSRGLWIDRAVREGIKKINSEWREKNADKSGG